MPDIIDFQLSLRAQRQPYILATVIEIVGSASAKPSAKAIIDQTGKLMIGWVGGGCAQSMIATTALQCLTTGISEVIDIDLTDEVFGAGMPCGGHMRVYLEPVLPRPMLWLMGHGLIVENICEFASRLGFDVCVNDPQCTLERFPNAFRLIHNDNRYQQLQPLAGDYVVIATHHKGDYDALTQALQSEARYIALVASQTRAQLVLSRLAQEGIANVSLSRIRAPAGLDLGAQSPEEIALAIVSEMVLLRRGGTGRSLSKNA